MSNPVLVEVFRGTRVESFHRGAVAVADAGGDMRLALGDVERPVYPRSAIKPLQALPLVESGAAAHFALGDEAIALACASHGGEPRHVETVLRWLDSIDLDASDLVCGPHLPSNEDAAHALVRADVPPGRVHNNCSGKHTGFLTTARFLGEPVAGYADATHPVQVRIRTLLEEMSGEALADATTGVDGCGIPTIAQSLAGIARAMARLGRPDGLGATRAAACARVLAAMRAQPWMVAGSGRFCTLAIEHLGGGAVVKVGAEGVYAASLPALGLGVAVKMDDGARRAAEVTLGETLSRIGALPAPVPEALAARLRPRVHNHAGTRVGRITPGPGWD